MREKRTAALLLYDVFQAIEKIETFCAGYSFDQFMEIFRDPGRDKCNDNVTGAFLDDQVQVPFQVDLVQNGAGDADTP